ncbi:MAG: heme o synthase [Acidobacteria bacterium]|nr:heme o synthase [Acidobacteriota bacterium]
MRAYIELTKPRITWLILMSAAVGFYFGLPADVGWRGMLEPWRLWACFHTMLGTGLLASGTAALNQWWEREGDGKMRRTAGRPIPSGRVPANGALLFGAAISVAGFAELALAVNMLSAFLGLFTLASYLFFYTPLKRRSWLCTTIGALPGAMPPMIGYAAAHGSLNPEAWILFAILFLWQFPHFYSIAWMYREDYARAGIHMLPVVEPDGRSTARQIVLYGLALIPVSLLPKLAGMAGPIYAAGALTLGILFLHSGLKVALKPSPRRARGVLMASIVYLPALYALILLDRTRLGS